jgi:hypothetical protein
MAALALGEILVINSVWSLVQRRFDLAQQPACCPGLAAGRRAGAGRAVGRRAGGVRRGELFPGFLYAGLRERWGVGWAVVISSAIFAALHLLPSVMLPVFVMGALFCGSTSALARCGRGSPARDSELAGLFRRVPAGALPGLANGGV